MSFRPLAALLSFCLGPFAAAQGGLLHYQVGGVEVRRSDTSAGTWAEWSRDGGQNWRALRRPDDALRFRVASFDPLTGLPPFAAPWHVPIGSRLRIVQFHTQVLPAYRDAITALGGEVLHYVPANGLLLRCGPAEATAIAQLACVRWLGGLPNGCKLDAPLRAFVQAGGMAPVECNLVLATKADRPLLLGQIVAVGGRVVAPCDGSTMVRAELLPAQLLALLDLDTVVWADVAGPDGIDMDIVRATGGADFVESVAGLTGQGVRVEVTEALDETHPDLFGRVLVRGLNLSNPHGHATAGIVGGSGAGNALARGMLPDAWLVEGPYSSAQHYSQIQDSVDPALGWRTMLATASWGAAAVTAYNSVSQAMDDALFDADLARVNSMGNNGNQLVRPEAWAKNVIAVGGVKHLGDQNDGNDRWNAPGDPSAASIGPASDGRIRPDVVGYFDGIQTIDLPGAPGYTTGNYVSSFGGTSAAAPMVAGHVGLLQQMFTDGAFGNLLPLPVADANRFDNRPHMTTAKALLCNTARQYPFAGTDHDLTRTHQGWGRPDVARAWLHRDRMVVVDEYDTLQNGEFREYWVQVTPNTPELRVTLTWADPAALPAAAVHLVNDLDLRVTRVADGVAWWGNQGLDAATVSKTGGQPDDRNTIECVYLENPLPGSYVVRVEAAAIVLDGKVETPAIDSDFALVMHPVSGFRDTRGIVFDAVVNGPGHLRFDCSNVPATGWTEGYTAVAVTTTNRPFAFGGFFGLEIDVITIGMWQLPAMVDNPFHFVPGTTANYPFASYTFDPAFVNWLAAAQLQVDAVLVLFDGPDLVAVSNVDRVRLQ